MKSTYFRAWDKGRGQMFEVFCYEQDSSRVSIDGDEFLAVPEEATLMQFTGFHDRNETPIYEGDILTTGEAGKEYVVEDLRDLAWREAQAAVVVGNVHEHPELRP
jgi:uncharacterized phage protein (TIGR01671 family)